LCPDGVKHVPLGEVGTTFGGLTGKSKVDFSGGNMRFISYMNIFGNIAVDTSADDFVTVKSGERQRTLRKGDVLFTGSSESADEVAMSAVVTVDVDEPLYLNSFSIGYRFNEPENFDPDFTKHLFRSSPLRSQLLATASGVTRFNVSKSRLARVKIPVLPIEIQREIATILDTMQNLKLELDAELECRHRQYAYYRRTIVRTLDCPTEPLGDLGRWQGGLTPSKSNSDFWSDGEIPWLASMDVAESGITRIRGRVTLAAIEQTSLRVVPAPSVAVVMRSNILRKRLPIGLVRVDTTVNQDVRALVPRSGVDAEYLDQVLRAFSEEIRSTCVRTDGSMAAVDSKRFFAFEVPLPLFDEQRRIAHQLRSFDTLVNDSNIGLPAEVRARRQQYEHYRDKLLTFEEAVV
jgi:type I restriction enzyme, S subunit